MPHSFLLTPPLDRRRWLARAAVTSLLVPGAVVTPALARSRHHSKAPATGRPPLAPGRYYWMPQLSPTGPVVVAVNLSTQLLQVFRNGIAIGFSSVSTGRAGYATPSGIFTVLEKDRHHRSSTYDDAPMPYMVRLTWQGVALHAGHLPGYPASHGCIRQPPAFAAQLFGVIHKGDKVLVVRNRLASGMPAMTMLAPITPDGRPLITQPALSEAEFWENPPATPAPDATPWALLASLPQQRLFVLRQGRLMAALALPEHVQQLPLTGSALWHWNATAENLAPQWQPAPGMAPGLSATLLQALWPAGPATERLRALLPPGSTLLATALHAVNDLHVDRLVTA